MTTIKFYSDMLQDPFIHELNGKYEDEMDRFWKEIQDQSRIQIINEFKMISASESNNNIQNKMLQLILINLSDIFFEDMDSFIRHCGYYLDNGLFEFKKNMVHVSRRLKHSLNFNEKNLSNDFGLKITNTLTKAISNMFLVVIKDVAETLDSDIRELYFGMKLMIENPEQLEKYVVRMLSSSKIISLRIGLKNNIKMQLEPLGNLTDFITDGISTILTSLTLAICIREIDNMGTKFKELKGILEYPVFSSRRELASIYLIAMHSIDATYDKLMRSIVIAYGNNERLGNLACDISLAAGEELYNFIEYGTAGLTDGKILHDNEKVSSYFLD